MCGILCLVSNINKPTRLQQLYNDCQTQIQRRGPDHFKSDEFLVNHLKTQLSASILWLQGESLVQQPINNRESFFCYNGDVFGGNAISIEDRLAYGDTKLFLNYISSRTHDISSALDQIQGPYAFIYYDKLDSCFYFGRDVFGRRSLLIALDKENDALLLTSVALKTDIPMIEVPTMGIFRFVYYDEQTMILEEWPKKHKHFDKQFTDINSFFQDTLFRLPVVQATKISIISKEHVKLNIFDDIKLKSSEKAFEYLLNNDLWKDNVIQLNLKLENALHSRISTQPMFCKNCIATRTNCSHCRVGILFSGGVDCTILTLIADKYVAKHTQIDLLNVAFDKVEDYNTPDRITGLQSLEELKKLRPQRHWNFVSINVTSSELDAARSEHIAHLIFPLNTILDDSLGCALWFASRGKSSTYESPCRVLLVGTGADELFGGYTHHRAAMKNGGIQGLQEALDKDWANIARRNLARDDRVVADHGRQLRTPYLDEEVVAFVQGLEVWEKTYPSAELAQGVGEKILLRTLAFHLGLRCAAGVKKRALQFGSRIANKKENAHEVSPRLML